MKYDFKTLLDRKGTNALAVDYLGVNPGFTPDPPKMGFDLIPMWVADMNFIAFPEIPNRIINRTNHPLYGYFRLNDDYYNAVINWHKVKNNVEGLERKNIGYENGVVGGVMSALKLLLGENKNLLVHAPTYSGFTFPLTQNGYNVILSDLILGEDNLFHMDYSDMEEKIKENNIKVVLLTSPHNPTGRVWNKDELEKLSELLEKYNVNLICDEIWSDIILNGNKHTPVQTVTPYLKNHTIAIYAPSKTFNLAGLIGSYHIVYNDELHKELLRIEDATAYNEPNLLSTEALIAAYSTEGMLWADELKEVLSTNVNFAYDYVKENFKGVFTTKPQGTYMLYLDCKEYLEENNLTLDELLKLGWDCGVAWQDGRPFNGKTHIRLNLALPTERVKIAFSRLSKYVFK